MLAKLKRFLRVKAPDTDNTPPVSASLSATPPPRIDVGLHDMRVGGWLNAETGELLEGFKISADDTVIDIGCGTGGYTLFCGRQGAEIYIADIDPNNVDAAATRLQETKARAIHKLVTDANPIPLPDATVTRVIAMEVMEHVDSPYDFLAELARVGKPGALFLISVPAAVSENAQRGIAPDSIFQKPNHIHVFESEVFEQLVTDAGLVIERRLNYGFYRTVWWFLYLAAQHPHMRAPWPPVIQQWDETWKILLSLPQGADIKRALDEAMPKSQVIIARKPTP